MTRRPTRTSVPLRERLAVSLLVALATLWYVQPVFNLRAMDRAIYWGDVRLNVWALAWNHRVFTGHAWPYFDGNIFHPHPATLAYSEHLFGIALPTLPLHLIGAPAALVYNIAWLALLSRCSAWPSTCCAAGPASARSGGAVAATLAACSFVRIHHTGHLQLLWLFGLPLAVYHLDRWREHPTPSRLVAWALSVLTTSLASWYLAVLVVFVHLTWWPRCVWPHRRHRAAVHAVLAALCVAAVLGVFARPYVGTSRGSLAEMRANAADAQRTWCLRRPRALAMP